MNSGPMMLRQARAIAVGVRRVLRLVVNDGLVHHIPGKHAALEVAHHVGDVPLHTGDQLGAAHVGRAVLNIHAACWCQPGCGHAAACGAWRQSRQSRRHPPRCTHPRAARGAWASSRSRPPGCGSGGRCARPAWSANCIGVTAAPKGIRRRKGSAQRGHHPVLGEAADISGDKPPRPRPGEWRQIGGRTRTSGRGRRWPI